MHPSRTIALTLAAAAGLLALTGCGDQVSSPATPSTSPSPSGPYEPSAAQVDEQLARGYDTSAKSDVRNLATHQETLLTDTNTYGTIAQIESSGSKVQVEAGVTVRVVGHDQANGYCLSSKHERSETTWFYDSQAGGLLPAGATGCTLTKGTPGDEKTGPAYTDADDDRARTAIREELLEVHEATEAARAQGPITAAERAEATGLVIDEVLFASGEAVHSLLTTNPGSPGAQYRSYTEVSKEATALVAEGAVLKMTHRGTTGAGLEAESGYCAEGRHELSTTPIVYVVSFGTFGVRDVRVEGECPYPAFAGGELRGAALSQETRAQLEQEIEENALGARIEATFTDEEESAEETGLQVVLRDFATAEEVLLTDTNSYGTIAQMRANQGPDAVTPPAGVTLTVVGYLQADSFCLSATDGDGQTLFYDSARGGVLGEGERCEVPEGGAPGDSVTG